MKQVLNVCLFILISSTSAAQLKPLPEATDSLRILLKSATDDTTLCRIHINLCSNLLYTNIDSAIIHGEKSLELAHKIKYPLMHSKSLNNLGICYKESGRHGEALKLLYQSYGIKDSLGEKALAAKTLTIIQDLYYRQGNFTKGIELMQQALTVLDTLQRPDVKAKIYRGFGDSYRGLKNLDSSIYYYEKTKALAEQAGAADEYGAAVNGLGLIYFDRQDFSKSAQYYEMSLDLARQLGRKDAEAISLLNSGTAYGMMGDLKKSYSYLQEAIEKAKQLNNLYIEYECYNSLSDIALKNKDLENGYVYMNRFKDLADSLKQLENAKLIAEYETKFETEKKEKEIQILNKDKKIQVQKLTSQRQQRNFFMGGFTVVLFFAGVFFIQRNKIKKSKERSDELLLNILPFETAEELKLNGNAEAKSYDEVTVMFTDFKDFTQASESLSAVELVKEIHFCYSKFDNIITKYHLEKIKTIGDSYMCAGGLPVPNKSNAEDIINAALEICAFVREEKQRRQEESRSFFEVRIGINSGPVVAGIVGVKKFAYDIWGDTVNIASRMESSGSAGKVNISGSTYELVKHKFKCVHRGKIQAKNKGEIDMYFVEND